MTPPKGLRERFHAAVKNEQIRDLERLWYAAGDDQSPFARELVSLDRDARRQVSGRRARREVRVHRPRVADRAAGARGQGRTGEDRRADQATRRGREDGADRPHRHGGARRVRRAGRHRPAQRAAAADARLPARDGRAARARTARRQLPAHAQGLSHLSGEAAGAALQRVGAVAHRPAPGDRSSARGPSNCRRRSSTSSATRWRTWTSPPRSSTR